MTRSVPAQLVLKEGRALAPIWLAIVATIVISNRTGQPVLGFLAFALGAVALGVYSVGHEYAHRTLTTLLAQPLSRSQLLVTKVIVLATLLALLTLVAALMLLPADAWDSGTGTPTAARWWFWLVLLTPVLGLSVAPWLTMMSRSVMGGLVFTIAVPAALWIAGQLTRVATVGFMADPFAYGPALTLMITGLATVSVVALVHGRAMFVRLEALDAPREIASSIRGTTSRQESTGVPSRRSHPVVMLVQKEIRLHALALVVAAIYALVWIAMRLTRMDGYIAGQSFRTISEFYGLFIALLVGAIASAEERALGTQEWQILQPWAQWKQIAIKVAMVGSVALTLGLVVPIALEAAFPLVGDTGHAGLRTLSQLFLYFGYGNRIPLAIGFVALFSFYVSTLCVGGLRALLVALPLSAGLAQLYLGLNYATYRYGRMRLIELNGPDAFSRNGFWWRNLPTYSPQDLTTTFMVEQWLSTVALVGFVVLILFLALRNSRSAERGVTIARKQLPVVLTYVALAAVIGRAAPAYVEWWLLTH